MERMRALLQMPPSSHHHGHAHHGDDDYGGAAGGGDASGGSSSMGGGGGSSIIGGSGGGGGNSSAPYNYHPSQMSISIFAPYGPIGSAGGSGGGGGGSSSTGGSGNPRARNAQRAVITDKTVRNMSAILASFSKPIEVVAHDVPREAVRVVIDTLFETEETYRRGMY